MTNSTLLRILTVCFLFIACKGSTGPAGPTGSTGPAGPQGLPGPAGADGAINRIEVTGVSNGNVWPLNCAWLSLPATVGTAPTTRPATAAYYTINPSTGIWLALSDGNTTTNLPYYGITFSGGVWNVWFVNVPALWTVSAVVHY